MPQVHHALTPEQVEVAYKEELGGLFDRVSDFIEDFTATLFGGKPTHRINLRRFVAGIDKDWAEGKPRQEWEAVQYLYVSSFGVSIRGGSAKSDSGVGSRATSPALTQS